MRRHPKGRHRTRSVGSRIVADSSPLVARHHVRRARVVTGDDDCGVRRPTCQYSHAHDLTPRLCGLIRLTWPGVGGRMHVPTRRYRRDKSLRRPRSEVMRSAAAMRSRPARPDQRDADPRRDHREAALAPSRKSRRDEPVRRWAEPSRTAEPRRPAAPAVRAASHGCAPAAAGEGQAAASLCRKASSSGVCARAPLITDLFGHRAC